MRVSTADQCLDRQILGLKDLCDELHSERVSAVARRRPVYDRIFAKLQRGDVLVVWDLDRAFRSLEDAIVEVRELHARGVGLEIVSMEFDRSTPMGRLLYTIRSAVAEYERDDLIQRTRQGIEAARRRGVRLGRPPKLSPDQLAQARRRLQDPAVTLTSLARELGVAPWSLTRSMRRDEQND